MSREIKFRQYMQGKFYFWGFLTEGGFSGPVSMNGVLQMSTQQFTGLKDKNGKEIYDGDIFGNIPELRAVVEWKDFGWVLRFFDSRMNKHPFPFDRFIPTSECVGNIYETPELLESK